MSLDPFDVGEQSECLPPRATTELLTVDFDGRRGVCPNPDAWPSPHAILRARVYLDLLAPVFVCEWDVVGVDTYLHVFVPFAAGGGDGFDDAGEVHGVRIRVWVTGEWFVADRDADSGVFFELFELLAGVFVFHIRPRLVHPYYYLRITDKMVQYVENRVSLEDPLARAQMEDQPSDKCPNCNEPWHDRIVPQDSRDIANLRNARLCSTVYGILIHHLEFND